MRTSYSCVCASACACACACARACACAHAYAVPRRGVQQVCVSYASPRSMSCVRVTSVWAYHTSDRERMSSHRAYINIGISFFRLELSRCISLSPSLPLPLPLPGETSSDPTSSIPFSVRVGADVGINERRLVPFVHLHTQTRPVTSAEAQKQRSITHMHNNLIGRTS